MRQVNTFCTVTVLLAVVLVIIHYSAIAVVGWWRADDKPRHRVPLATPPPPLCLPPPAHEPQYTDAWVTKARQVAFEIAAERGEVTVDDVWERCPPVPGMDGRIMMAAFPRSEWEVIGYRPSARADQNHGRRVAVWRRREDVAA